MKFIIILICCFAVSQNFVLFFKYMYLHKNLFMCFLVRIPEYVLYPSKCSLFFRACADKMTSTYGQNLASRENQRPDWGAKDFGAQLWALKMTPGTDSFLVR